MSFNKVNSTKTFGMTKIKGNIIAASSFSYPAWPEKLAITCSRHDMVTSAAKDELSDPSIIKKKCQVS